MILDWLLELLTKLNVQHIEWYICCSPSWTPSHFTVYIPFCSVLVSLFYLKIFCFHEKINMYFIQASGKCKRGTFINCTPSKPETTFSARVCQLQNRRKLPLVTSNLSQTALSFQTVYSLEGFHCIWDLFSIGEKLKVLYDAHFFLSNQYISICHIAKR